MYLSKDLCAYYKIIDSATEKDPKKDFKGVLPLCNACKAFGEDSLKRVHCTSDELQMNKWGNCQRIRLR